MMSGMNARQGNAVEIDANQGGNKAAERPGANKGMVEHHMVDAVDHAGHASRAKKAAAEHGHHNVEYYHGGKM